MNTHKHAPLTPSGRERMVNAVLADGLTYREAAASFRISVPTVGKWVRRYREQGAAGLQDRSSRPRRFYRPTPLPVVEQLVALRLSGLTGVEIARRLRMGRSTVFRLLGKVRLSRQRDLVPSQPENRYECEHPGELLHVDIKKLGRFERPGHRVTNDRRGQSNMRRQRIGWEFVHVCIDDHTRLAYVEVMRDEKAASAIAFLKRAVSWFRERGVSPQRLMSDNGSCYRSKRFQKTCKRLGLRQTYTKPYTPRTNGKAERFIKTLVYEWAYARSYETSNERRRHLPAYLKRYNRRRPHASLGGRPPISRLREARR